MPHISETGYALYVADSLRQNAILAEQRWLERMEEASAHREAALAEISAMTKTIDALKRRLS